MMPKRILVVRTDRIGDVVLTTPALRALRHAYPQAKISVLLSPSTVDLIKGLPYIDEVLVDDRLKEHQGMVGFLRLCRLLRSKAFDTAIVFHTKRRYNLACFLAGIEQRIGFKNNKGGRLLTQPLKDERHEGLKHEAEYCLDVVGALGAKPAGLELCVPHEVASDQWALLWYKEHVPEGFQLILIHPGASDETKCWPAKNFAELISHLSRMYMVKVAIIGGRDTVNLAKEIIKDVNVPVFDLTNQCTLSQTVALLRRANILVSNDSGPVHVGVAAGCGVVSLFLRNQPGLNAKRWKPLGMKSITLETKPEEAIILNKQSQIVSGNKSSITVDQVIEAVDTLKQKDIQSIFLW